MTLYEFNLLDDIEQYNTVWNKGVFLDTTFENGLRINIYAIDMFFVEVCYDSKLNKIVDKRSFKEGHRLDKYSKGIQKFIRSL